jgi:hypothetical protein
MSTLEEYRYSPASIRSLELTRRAENPSAQPYLGPEDSVSRRNSPAQAPIHQVDNWMDHLRKEGPRNPQSDWSLNQEEILSRDSPKLDYLPYMPSLDTSYVELSLREKLLYSYYPSSAKLINVVQRDPELNERRRVARYIGMKIYKCPQVLEAYHCYLSLKGIQWAGEYLHKLEQLCLFLPDWQHKSTGEPVMYLDQDFYCSFYRDLKHLECMYLTRKTSENEPPHPKVPTYPETGKDYGFNKQQHEIDAVLYRDEVERFLAYVYRERRRNEGVSRGKEDPTTVQLSLNGSSFLTPDSMAHRSYEPVALSGTGEESEKAKGK